MVKKDLGGWVLCPSLNSCMKTFPMTTSPSSLNTVLKTTVTLSFLDLTDMVSSSRQWITALYSPFLSSSWNWKYFSKTEAKQFCFNMSACCTIESLDAGRFSRSYSKETLYPNSGFTKKLPYTLFNHQHRVPEVPCRISKEY